MRIFLLLIILTTLFLSRIAGNDIANHEVLVDSTNLALVDSLTFHEQFSEVFEEIIEIVEKDSFLNVVDSELVIVDSVVYQKIDLDLPFRGIALFQEMNSQNEDNTITLKIFRDSTSKKNIHPLLRDSEYYAIYDHLVKEFQNVQKLNLGGNWQMKWNQNGVKLHMLNYPFLKVYVKPSGKTGLDLKIDLP